MPELIKNQLWLSITVIEAQQMMMDITTSSYAHMKKNDQDRVHRSVSAKANPQLFEEISHKKPLSMKEMASLMSEVRNGR